MSLRCQASWVSCPVALVLYNEVKVISVLVIVQTLMWSQGRIFTISVDPSNLTPNEVHFADIVAIIDDAGSNGYYHM